MAGNVNEWVQDVYRPLTSDDVDEFNPFRGNVYTDLRRDANGQVVTKGNLGKLYVDTVKPVDVSNRYNYQKGDYRNYKDGDYKSVVGNPEDWKNEANDNKDASLKMYAQSRNAAGKPTVDFVTLINDNARVYKGGSWKDRAYWLNPSTRRFLDQTESRDDIGFRCAMIRVGSPAGN
jgi:formylglycine-generating enzyme required for sulfatase activity